MHNDMLHICGAIVFSDKSEFQNAKYGNGRQIPALILLDPHIHIVLVIIFLTRLPGS